MPSEVLLGIIAGISGLITVCCAAMHRSRCTEIDCDCCGLHITRELIQETQPLE